MIVEEKLNTHQDTDMKTTLTVEESQRLIDLGVDPKMASMVSWKQTETWARKSVLPNKEHLTLKPFKPMVIGFERFETKDVFTLTDILRILPKEIEHNGLTYGLNMWVENATYFVEYCAENGVYDYLIDSNISAPELIDALNALLIWVLENGHLKTEKKQ